MVGLLDIAPMTATVTIRGIDLQVSGITADGLVHILKTFPELQRAFAGQGMDPEDLQMLISKFGGTVGEIIAMGCGHPGDGEYIAFAMTQLGAGEQLELLQAIFGLTFPKGVKSFLDALTKAADSAGVRGRAQPMKSPAPSKDSSNTDTESNTAGQ